MPVTPFHFGPGALLKACAPRAVSLTAFALSQVLIDIESGYHLLWGGWPLHRQVHSLLVSAAVGMLTGMMVWLVGRRLPPSLDARAHSELDRGPALLGGLVGGLSHPVLDAFMHADVQPFWPISDANPLLGRLELGPLHLLCVVTGIAGVAILFARWRSAAKPARGTAG